MSVRLQKFLAESGVASRRSGERLILEGRVTVNGRVAQELGTKIDPVADKVSLDGRPLKAKPKLYVALHKPPRCVCTRHDPEDRPCAGQFLPKEWTNLQSVGRLDFHSEGLIFFTNDGDFALRLTHPRYGTLKKYRVVAKGEFTPAHARLFAKGVASEGEMLRADQVRILKANGSHSLLEISLREGKNRQIRRMFEVIGLEVERLQRVQIGPIKLGELPSGKWRTLTSAEIRSLVASADRSRSSAVPPVNE